MNSFFGDLPAQLFSPFKLFYLVYAVLLYRSAGCIDWSQFLLISFFFLAGEILHNDYWRIKLNHAACQKCQCSDIDVRLKIAELEVEKERIKK